MNILQWTTALLVSCILIIISIGVAIYYRRINTTYYTSLMYIGEKLCIQLTQNGYTIRLGTKNYCNVTDGEPLPNMGLSSVIGVIVAQNYIKVYQDGNILKTFTCDNSNVLNFATNYYIGKRSDNGDRKAKYIYSFKMYNRELTEDEIIRNYNYEMRKPISLNAIKYFEVKEV